MDIETFLQEKAVDFLNRRWCSVYLVFDGEAFEGGRLQIEGYFTLSHKSMVADTKYLSKSQIKKYGGFKDARTLDFVLIGQLGKYVRQDGDKKVRSSLTGKELLDMAFEVIQEANDLIPCKHVLVECSDEAKVKHFYESNGFHFFQKDGRHNQYTKTI